MLWVFPEHMVLVWALQWRAQAFKKRVWGVGLGVTWRSFQKVMDESCFGPEHRSLESLTQGSNCVCLALRVPVLSAETSTQ